MKQNVYRRLFNSFVADIKSELCNYPYVVTDSFNKHVSSVNVISVGEFVTGTAFGLVNEVCKRHSLQIDFGCSIVEGHPCLYLSVYNI